MRSWSLLPTDPVAGSDAANEWSGAADGALSVVAKATLLRPLRNMEPSLAVVSGLDSPRGNPRWAFERAKRDRPLEVGQMMAIVVADQISGTEVDRSVSDLH